MAFIQSIHGLNLNKSLRNRHVSQICQTTPRTPYTMKIEFDQGAIETGLKFLAVSGAIVISYLATPEQARAALLKFPSERPTTLGVRYGRYLNNCPTSPNCVSSSANVYDSHYVPAWTYNAVSDGGKKSMKEAIDDVTDVLKNYPRTTIVESMQTNSDVGTGYYIYAECASKLLGFVDDVEIFFQPDNTTVEYRSASRLGEKDFDVNRKRIRDIRVALQEKDKRWASVGYN